MTPRKVTDAEGENVRRLLLDEYQSVLTDVRTVRTTSRALFAGVLAFVSLPISSWPPLVAGVSVALMTTVVWYAGESSLLRKRFQIEEFMASGSTSEWEDWYIRSRHEPLDSPRGYRIYRLRSRMEIPLWLSLVLIIVALRVLLAA